MINLFTTCYFPISIVHKTGYLTGLRNLTVFVVIAYMRCATAECIHEKWKNTNLNVSKYSNTYGDRPVNLMKSDKYGLRLLVTILWRRNIRPSERKG